MSAAQRDLCQPTSPHGAPHLVPAHAPGETAWLVRTVRACWAVHGIAEEDLDGWIRQATNGMHEHLRCCGRAELLQVLQLVKLRLGQRFRTPRRRRA